MRLRGNTPAHRAKRGTSIGRPRGGGEGQCGSRQIMWGEAPTDNGSPEGWSQSERGGGPPSDTECGAGDPARRTPRKGGGGEAPN